MIAVLLAGTVACSGDESSPTTPSSSLNLTGTYTGDITVQGAPARMVWTLTQGGASVTGAVIVALPTGTVLLNGVLAGTLSGSALTYTITVSPGGIPSQPTCSGQLAGTATAATSASLSGAYTVVSSSCASPLTNGTFALTRG